MKTPHNAAVIWQRGPRDWSGAMELIRIGNDLFCRTHALLGEATATTIVTRTEARQLLLYENLTVEQVAKLIPEEAPNHELLHDHLDTLAGMWAIAHPRERFSDHTIMELMIWSHQQTVGAGATVLRRALELACEHICASVNAFALQLGVDSMLPAAARSRTPEGWVEHYIEQAAEEVAAIASHEAAHCSVCGRVHTPPPCVAPEEPHE